MNLGFFMVVGITPAYAGKSVRLAEQNDRKQDHPRLRGEKHVPDKVVLCLSGSPPLTRGKEGDASTGAGTLGITPAYAGKRE